MYYAIRFTPFLLVVNLGLGSQQHPLTFFGFPLNQIINWFVILGASIVVKNTYPARLWPIITIACVISSKFLSTILGYPPPVELVYRVFLSGLFFTVGIIYLYRYLDLFYKQMLIICFFNVIMMVLQVTNAGEWTQFLSTESTFKYAEKITYDVLFVPLEQLQFSIIQGRPSGFLRSNNILSGVLLFALALHFSRFKNRRKWWGTFVLCSMIVLASARIVYVGYFVILVLLLLKGNKAQRKSLINSFILLLILLQVYSFFLPGLFDRFWEYSNLTYSIFLRLNDIVGSLGTENFLRILLEKPLEGTPIATWAAADEVLSGYTLLLNYVPYLVTLFLVLLPLYIRGIRIQNRIFPHLTWPSILCLIVFILYPAAVPIFRDQFYWVIGGFALLPIFIMMQPNYFKRVVRP